MLPQKHKPPLEMNLWDWSRIGGSHFVCFVSHYGSTLLDFD